MQTVDLTCHANLVMVTIMLLFVARFWEILRLLRILLQCMFPRTHCTPVGQCPRVGTVGTSDRVALQAAQAIVENGEESMRVRVLFDSGSHRSFITSCLVSRLNLEPVISENIGIKLFGTNVPETKVRNVVELSLMPISSNARESVKLQAIVVDEIAEIPNVHTEIIKNDLSIFRVSGFQMFAQPNRHCL